MEWFRNILSRMDGTPKAKRRFNLLREQAPPHPATRRGFASLASFILVTSIPLAGIWQIQSDLDPSLALAPPRPTGRMEEMNARGSTLLPGPSAAMCLIRNDGRRESGLFSLEQTDADKDANPADFRLCGNDGQGAGEWPDHVSPRNGRSKGGFCEGSNATSAPDGRRDSHPQKARPSHSLSPRAKIEAFYRKAQSCQRRKNFEVAVQMYRRVLREDPGHCDALFHLSSIYLEQGLYDEAYPLVQDLVRRRPGDPHGLVNLAIAEIALGRPVEAIAHLDTALTLENPPRFRIYLNKAVALSRLQRLAEAITWYRKAAALEPHHRSLLFNMAVTLDRLGRYTEALRLYTMSLEAGEPPAPRERRKIEVRIGVLMAYLAEGAKTPPAAGANGSAERER